MMAGSAVAPEEEEAASLCARLIRDLHRLTGLAEGTDELLERHMVSRLANALRIDYDPAMETAAITRLLQQSISDTVVEDLRPFVQVAVCMGWADGRLRPEEIGVVDAALSRLKLLMRRRSELLSICTTPIAPAMLADALAEVAKDDQKAWSVLALGWAVALADMKTHPQEIRVFHEIAAHLGISPERADTLRELVTRRFQDSLGIHGPLDAAHPSAPRALAKATMAAITAAELDSYLHAMTGLKSLSLLLSTSVRVGDHNDSMSALDAMLVDNGWFGAPALLAGTLFLRRLGGDELNQQLLILVLTCLERGR